MPTPYASPMASSRTDGPRDFAAAVAALAAAEIPAAVELDDLPAPRNLAPFAHAIGGAVPAVPAVSGDEEVDLSGGRLVLLHRPGGHDEWRGAWRVVVLAEADLEPEIAEDPLLAGVAWSWLLDALADSGARYTAESGTVSRSSSLGFGSLAGRPATTAVEIRASWTPLPGPDGAVDFAAHLRAWCALMMMCAGLPPEPGVGAPPHPAGARR